MQDFDKLILTDKEKHSLRDLRRNGPAREDNISCFSALKRYGFLEIAHPKTMKKDGYGGYIFDKVYCLSDEYERYEKYLRSKGLSAILEAIGALKP